MTKRDDGYREVYSTERGTICPECSRPIAGCQCAARKAARIAGDGQVRVRRETKGRGGKTVTTISGLPVTLAQIETIARELKQQCGCGGAVKDSVIELQGDRCDTVIADLTRRGYKPKRAGG